MPDQVESESRGGSPLNRKLIFLSYASPDRGAAERLAGEIEAVGISCWMAPRDVPFGSNYAKAILDAIEAAEAFVVLLSSSANRSTHVANEIERAVNYQKTIVPLRLENVKPSREIELHISARQWVDLFEGPQQREQNMRRFLDVLRDILRAWLVPELPALSGASAEPAAGRSATSQSPPNEPEHPKPRSGFPDASAPKSKAEMLQALDGLLSETTQQNQSRAGYRLQAIVSPTLRDAAIDHLHSVLETDADGAKRWAAALMLIRLGSSDVARFRAALFKEPTYQARVMMVRAAKNFSSDAADDYLFEICVSDDDDDVRTAALVALAARNRDRSIEAVREFLSAGVKVLNYGSKAQAVIAPVVNEGEVQIVFELSNLTNGEMDLSALSMLGRFTRESLLRALNRASVNSEQKDKIRKALETRPA
jgi:hypothetical protein